MKSILKVTVMLIAAFALASGAANAGSSGSKGSKGSHGSHGSKSSKGSHGSHGSKGSKGSHGSHGSKGSKGSHGSKGSKGSKGSGDNGCECDGGITMLMLEYNGPDGDIEAYDKKNNPLFFGPVLDGGTVAINGMEKDGKIGSKFFITVDNGMPLEIHTSCSQPIEVGSVFGPFTVLAGTSRNNGMLCGEVVEQCPDPCEGLGPVACCAKLNGGIDCFPDG